MSVLVWGTKVGCFTCHSLLHHISLDFTNFSGPQPRNQILDLVYGRQEHMKTPANIYRHKFFRFSCRRNEVEIFEYFSWWILGFFILLKMAASESEPSLEITCDSTILAIPGTTQLVPSMSEPFPEATTMISSPVTNTFQMGRYTLQSNCKALFTHSHPVYSTPSSFIIVPMETGRMGSTPILPVTLVQ